MDFGYDARTQELREQLLAFMDEFVYPAEPVFEAQQAEQDDPWGPPPVVEELKKQAREAGKQAKEN